MGQYNRIKAKYPNALLLFRVGDFYETFGQDAIIASEVLGIVLTKRHNGAASETELAGFPHHSLDTYLPKLVKAGHRVAICDQLENPKLTKKIVKRGVTELVTPGVALNDKILDHKSNNFLASVFFGAKTIAIAFLDVSTGEFSVASGNKEYIDKLIQGFNPAEVIFSRTQQKKFKSSFPNKFYTYALDEWIYSRDYCSEKLLEQYQVSTLKGFGIDEDEAMILAAGAAMHYLTITEHNKLNHLQPITIIPKDRYVWLDRYTTRNLELLNSNHIDGTPLIKVIDRTYSPMGARLMRRWVSLPLKIKKDIDFRLDVVEFFIKNADCSNEIENALKTVGDLERLVSKVATLRITPRELLRLKQSLEVIGPIKEACKKSGCRQLNQLSKNIDTCANLIKVFSNSLMDDAPVSINKGNVIKPGISKELDELRTLASSGKQYLAELQVREAEKTGINSLKIGFNNVFGYYLEVRNTYKDKVPDEWIRKQTLVSAERYITEELKEYEEKITGAEEKILALETKLFQQLIEETANYLRVIQNNSKQLAQLDCLLSFKNIALKNQYRKPQVVNGDALKILEGRHPVIEHCMPPEETYIPNDTFLDNQEQQIIIITGPNMAGKSALLRQTALIVLMAQIGCYVPAKEAQIGIVDKIFTRVGASDNISGGESTFMVEMIETSSIINNISSKSLVLLDEIGRGTSTYDGISIAWSLVEYLHQNKKAQPKTMFATHYHELNELANRFPRVKNYTISIKEAGNKVIFLRKLIAGGSKHSFGIHVAQMAGLPKAIIERANEILKELETKSIQSDITNSLQQLPKKDYQLSIFEMNNPELQELKKYLELIDINTLTPVEALIKISELKKIIE